MSVVLKTERKSLKSILLYILLYLILSIGGLTMIYPFLLMFSGSFSSKIDANEFKIIPSFLVNEEVLYQKYISSKYNENFQDYLTINNDNALNFSLIQSPSEFKEELINDWILFHNSTAIPTSWYLSGFGPTRDGKIIQENERAFRKYIQKICENNISIYREKYNESIESWFFLKFQPERLTDRKYQLSNSSFMNTFYSFKKQLPLEERIFVSCDGEFRKFLKLKYGVEEEINHLSESITSAEWKDFVKNILHPQFINVSDDALLSWRNFLNNKYQGNIEFLNKTYNESHSSFESVLFPGNKINSSPMLTDFLLFISHPNYLDINHIILDTPEIQWRKFLEKKYEYIENVSSAHGRIYKSFTEIKMPQPEFEWKFVKDNKTTLINRFMVRNYHMVVDYILLYGKGLYNTLIYCILSILLALIVNPLAAYALSRYNLPSQYKILLFLIATMAFPAVVTMIPNFLLLRDLGLLNTFAALLLPGMANGYSIFLLKGFFDSLPKELYEAADIDGATEWNKFWIITMNLSKPILAVVALGAFSAAYSNFMYAFILCQDRDMWTLMVWLYQLQQFSSQGVVFASLIIAAIPTLIVFICFQNVILRGIVVPTEK